MGKHETSYPRVERDHYPTPSWVVDALAEHVELVGKVVWECATGAGQMAEALKAAGATVYATDIARCGYPLDEVIDFLSTRNPKLSPRAREVEQLRRERQTIDRDRREMAAPKLSGRTGAAHRSDAA
jgi:hypothetical protein